MKLTQEQIIEYRSRKNPLTFREIGKKHGISGSAVHQILYPKIRKCEGCGNELTKGDGRKLCLKCIKEGKR